MAEYQLEIHHIDVTGGDSIFVLVRRCPEDDDEDPYAPVVYTMLVDTGGVGKGPQKLLQYISIFFPELEEIDLFVASHYHDDHIRGVTYKDKQGGSLAFKQVLDIGANTDFHPKGITTFDSKAQKNPGYLTSYNKFSKTYAATTRVLPDFLNPDKYHQGKPIKPLPIHTINIEDDETGTGYSIKFWCGKGVLADGTDVINQQKHFCSSIDANDLSIAFTIEGPGDFSYFSGGDLSGDPSLKYYLNIEGPLMNLLTNHFPDGIKVVKASHHGSERNNHKKDGKQRAPSSNITPGFLETLRPELLIVPCNQCKQVPAADFLRNRLLPYLDGDENRRSYFLNKVFYKKGKVAEAMDELVQQGQTNIIYDETKKAYRIDRATSLTVVHQEQKKFYAPFDNDTEIEGITQEDQPNFKVLHPRTDYQVYQNRMQIGFADAFGVKNSDQFYIPFSPAIKRSIMKGFAKQVDEIWNWYKEGFKEEKNTDVDDYIYDLYPALLKAEEFPVQASEINENFRKTLLTQMTQLFSTCFEYVESSNDYNFRFGYDGEGVDRKRKVPEEVEETVTELMIGNIHQTEYNMQKQRQKLEAVFKVFNYLTPFEDTVQSVSTRINRSYPVILRYSTRQYRQNNVLVKQVAQNMIKRFNPADFKELN